MDEAGPGRGRPTDLQTRCVQRLLCSVVGQHVKIVVNDEVLVDDDFPMAAEERSPSTACWRQKRRDVSRRDDPRLSSK